MTVSVVLSKGAPSFPAHYGNKLPQMASAVPPFPSLSTQTFPSYSTLLPSPTSPGICSHISLFIIDPSDSESAQLNENQPIKCHDLTSICPHSGQLKAREGAQKQLSSQGVPTEYQPRPMHSPPPLRRASLPLFQANYNPANPPPPPLHNSLAHTPPLFLDALEGGSSLPHRDPPQPLQTDTRSAPHPQLWHEYEMMI